MEDNRAVCFVCGDSVARGDGDLPDPTDQWTMFPNLVDKRTGYSALRCTKDECDKVTSVDIRASPHAVVRRRSTDRWDVKAGDWEHNLPFTFGW